ncbi:ParA family protein [Photobacterium leiognathi]|uniref:ParA family protein n=1 Tax=Photobacterium leiognathi TaxID=553611 RepID=UPI002981D0DF|nr:AAA family ATPase [Photobacterium leiognathi]
MATKISIFNNKGGVGKTTYMYHIAHLLAEKNKKVLMVDLDSQCNLSAYSIDDKTLLKSWGGNRGHGGNSIWRIIEPIYKGIGDHHKRRPTKVKDNENLYIVPGDISLSTFEDLLGDTWNGAKGGAEQQLRVQSAIHRYIDFCAKLIKADVVMLDLGPNLGALNRSVLASSDYFIVPMSPDLFSIRGTENLGKKLALWNKEWKQCHDAWDGDESLSLPNGKPKFLGFVTQQHNLRNNQDGMTKGWKIFGDQVVDAVQKNIIDVLEPLDQVYKWPNDQNSQLGSIPNLHSLIPYSLSAKKPVFHCTSADKLTGAHITRAAESRSHFDQIMERLISVI